MFVLLEVDSSMFHSLIHLWLYLCETVLGASPLSMKLAAINSVVLTVSNVENSSAKVDVWDCRLVIFLIKLHSKCTLRLEIFCLTYFIALENSKSKMLSVFFIQSLNLR